jgi:hypothetical protein
MSTDTTSARETQQFAQQSNLARSSLLAEFVDFLKHNKKWWLLPIVVALSVVGLLIVAGGGAAAPFIYTLF